MSKEEKAAAKAEAEAKAAAKAAAAKAEAKAQAQAIMERIDPASISIKTLDGRTFELDLPHHRGRAPVGARARRHDASARRRAARARVRSRRRT